MGTFVVCLLGRSGIRAEEGIGHFGAFSRSFEMFALSLGHLSSVLDSVRGTPGIACCAYGLILGPWPYD